MFENLWAFHDINFFSYILISDTRVYCLKMPIISTLWLCLGGVAYFMDQSILRLDFEAERFDGI